MNKIFTTDNSILFQSWERSLLYLEDETVILIILSGLYERDVITLSKLKGQLKSLRAGTLQRYKKTYHCTINNVWYCDEPAIEVFKDLYINYQLKHISIIKIIEVLQLYLNRNYNYCIDYIVSNIFQRLLNSFSNSRGIVDFNYCISVQIKDFPVIEIKGHKSECYECGNVHLIPNHRETMSQIDDIIAFFHQYKKGNIV